MFFCRQDVQKTVGSLAHVANPLVQLPEHRLAAQFFPAYSPEDRMRAYAVLGGMPAYLRAFDPGRPIGENIADAILDAGCMLEHAAMPQASKAQINIRAVY